MRSSIFLEMAGLGERIEHMMKLLEAEIDLFNVEKRVRGRVKKQMEKSQREYYLNEQMKAIQKELGDMDDVPNELDEIQKRLLASGMPKEARDKTTAELSKLKMMSPMSAEATVVRSYIDWMLGVPWKKRSKVRTDIAEAEAVLNADHYGLEEVKDRILEYLAVQRRVRKIKGPVLCLVGPPGVGKTSLGESIARATNRKFVRMAVGGVRDEAEIRGHRRTYIGSMPGKDCSESCRRVAHVIRCSCLMRLTRWARIIGVTLLQPCWKSWTRSRTTHLMTIISTSTTICLKSCSFVPLTR